MHTTEWFKSLADDTRLRTFRILSLAKVELCVAECADILQKPPYAVSRALGDLRKAGLLREMRRGKLVFYTLADPSSVRTLANWVVDSCQCGSTSQARNHDGSHQPGADPCAYDAERLAWRLDARGAGDEVLITTRPEQTAGDGRERILFVCVHNSARSQLAEEYLRRHGGEYFQVESAGLQPGTLNPHVVQVLAEDGIDISTKTTRGVIDLYRQGRTFDWVITVCSREAEENCPIFPGPVRRLSWPFEDPAAFTGSPEDVLGRVRSLARTIEARVKEFVQEYHHPVTTKEAS